MKENLDQAKQAVVNEQVEETFIGRDDPSKVYEDIPVKGYVNIPNRQTKEPLAPPPEEAQYDKDFKEANYQGAELQAPTEKFRELDRLWGDYQVYLNSPGLKHAAERAKIKLENFIKENCRGT